MKGIFCRVAEGLIHPRRCSPEDKKCLPCPHRKKKRKATSVKSLRRPAISEVEKIFEEKVLPQLRRWKLFTGKPYRGRVAEDSYIERIYDPYRISNLHFNPDVFSRMQSNLRNRKSIENLEGRKGGIKERRNLWEQRLINCSKQFMQNYELFKTNPRPFPEAEKLCEFLSTAQKDIDKSFRVVSPWLDKQYCDELIAQIKGSIEKLSSHIQTVIGPDMGGKTRPQKWPINRYLAQLAQLYELNTGKPAERIDSLSGTTGLFFKFAEICFKNLGLTLTKDQIDFFVRQYRKNRYSSVFHPW